MKKIKVTIICAGKEVFPRCSYLLKMCPEVRLLAQPASMHEAGAWVALAASDILILDEATLEQDGVDAVRGLHASYPAIRSLLVVDNYNKNNILSALSLGIQGVIARDALLLGFRKALTAIHAGEAWVPRALVEPLRNELVYIDKMARWTRQLQAHPGRDKLN